MPAMECKKVDEPSRSSFKKFCRTAKAQIGRALSWRTRPGVLVPTYYFLLTSVRTVVAVCSMRGVRTSSPSDLAFASSLFATLGVIWPTGIN